MSVLDSIRKALGDVAAEVRQTERQVEELKQQREWLESAPLPREEFEAKLCRLIDMLAERDLDRGKGFPWKMRKHVDGLIHRPLWEADPAKWDLFALNPTNANQHGVTGEVLTWYLRDLLYDGVKRAVAAMEYPDAEAGPPLAEREQRIPQIDAEIEQLEARVAEVRAEADRAGIQIDHHPRG